MPDTPTTTRLEDLTISQVAGVDYGAHLHDGWAVIKSAAAAAPVADAIDAEHAGLSGRLTKAGSLSDLSTADQTAVGALIDRLIALLDDSDDDPKTPAAKAAAPSATAETPATGADTRKEVGMPDPNPETALPEAVAARLDDLEKAVKTLTTERDDARAELAKAKDADTGGPDDIYKGLSPAAVEHFKKQAAELDEVKKAAETERNRRLDGEYLAKAAGFAAPIEREALAKAMRTADEHGGDVADVLPRLLRAYDEMAKQAGITKMFGTDGTGDSQNPQDQLDALVKARVADKHETVAKAYAAVLDTPEGQKLYEQADQSTAAARSVS